MGDYSYRPGTRENFGFEYEDQMIAYLALAACNRKDLKDFWIASNIVGLGAWDDIILYTETQDGGKQLHFLQLKHKANIDTENKFKDWKNDFTTYIRDYEQISSLMSYDVPNKDQFKIRELLNKTGVEFKRCEFILVTNAVFKTHVRLLLKSKDSFIKTNVEGTVYQLSPNMTDLNTPNNFFEQFFIFSEQSGVNDNSLLNNIESQLKLFITYTNFKFHTEVANCFPMALKNWFLSENRTLSVTDVQENISSCILSALKHTKPINSNCPALDKNEWEIFQKLIEPYQLVVYSDRELTLENFFDADNGHYFINCKMSDIEFVIRCIKSVNNIKVIMLVPNAALGSITETDISTLNLLNTLPVESLAVLNNYDTHIQGRRTIFRTLLTHYSDLKNIFRVDDVINLLVGQLRIGEDNKFLSYYVPRSIPRIFVETSIIFKMSDAYFIIIVDDNLLELELNEFKSYFQSKSNQNDGTIENRFKCVKSDVVSAAISTVGSKYSCVHTLKHHKNEKDFTFEWLSSSANIKAVKNFIKKEKCDLTPMSGSLVDLCWNVISKILIVANPGMGKTYFLRNLMNTFRMDSWVIYIILNEIDFDKTETFQSCLEEFHTNKLNARDKEIYEVYLRKGSVVVLFDGFDEVAPDNNVNALNLINGAIKANLKIVVTSREVTKVFLEENLETIAYTLNPFSNDDKQSFLEHFYLRNIKEFNNLNTNLIGNRIKTFASNLINNCSISAWDEEFTGVPMQCRLLAEGFLENCQRYCVTNDLSEIPINTNLISLYEIFIDRKFDIYWQEKVRTVTKDMKSYKKITQPHRKEFISNHMDAAVQIIFPTIKIKISDEFLKEIKSANEKHGIIIGLDGNKNPIFIHRTFAEYFAAKWLVGIKEEKKQIEESKREEYLRLLLKPELNVVQDLFDRIVCKQCELHSAILNAELSKVRDIFQKSGNRDDGNCGRNALHLISARGARHERMAKKDLTGVIEYWTIERIKVEEYLEILEFLIENSVWIEEKDKVLRLTPQQFANDGNAFGVIDILCGFDGSQLYNLENEFIAKWNKMEVLNMCATYSHSRLADKIIQSKGLNSKQLISMTCDSNYRHDQGTLLHVAAENGSVKILDVFLKYIDANIKSTVGETPLHWASRAGHLSVVKALMKNGSNFLSNNYGWTPIDTAMLGKNFTELVEYLTSYDALKTGFGEDINAPLDEKLGRRALHFAAMGKNMTSLERLITEGADVNITDKQGDTSLHCITLSKYFNVNIARCLLEVKEILNSNMLKQNHLRKSGFDIDAKNSKEETALHFAADKGNKEFVECLLQYGANPNIVDNKQQTPLTLARKRMLNDIFLILWEKTAEELRSERDTLYQSVLTEGHNVEVRKKTFVGYPEKLSHLVDKMSLSGLYYCGFLDNVNCFSCNCWLRFWKPTDDPWIKHARFNQYCQFLIQEKGKEFIELCKKKKTIKNIPITKE